MYASLFGKQVNGKCGKWVDGCQVDAQVTVTVGGEFQVRPQKQYSTAQHSTVRHSTAQYNTEQHS
eukprot:8457426-Pyramimonas_sp.AAC.1